MGLFLVAVCGMGTDGIGHGQTLWAALVQSTGSSHTFSAQELSAMPLFPVPLIPSLLGGSLPLNRIKYIPGAYQLRRQQNPAPLKGFSLSSFHSLKK